MADAVVAELIVEVSGRQTNLDALLKRLSAELRKTQADAGTAADAVGTKLGAGQQKGAQSALAHAQALARLAAAQGDTAGAVEVLKRALDGADKSATSTIRAQTQLAQLQGRLRKELDGSKNALQQLTQTAGGFGAALGTLGFSVGIGAIAQFTINAAAQANQLEKTKAALSAVAGDQARYSEVLRIAAANQKLFGGTLQANLAPLQQFLFISNRTGASLEELNRVAQLLATVNPAAGIEGAGFSLSEVLSGDITSIVERFNLPRAAIRELVQESDSAGEVLAGITELLGTMGVTSETLASSLNTNAATYDRLGAAASNLTTQLGALAAQGFAPVAAAATDVFNRIAGGLEQLQQLGQGNTDLRARLLEGASSYEEYSARITQAQQLAAAAMDQAYEGDPIGRWVAEMTNAQPVVLGLSQAQFQLYQTLIAAGVEAGVAAERAGEATNAQLRYAEELQNSGVAAGDAAQQALAYGDAINAVNTAQGQLWDDATISSAALQQLAGDMEFLTGSSDANRAAVTDLAASYSNGSISAIELYDQVNALITAHFNEVDANQAVIDAAYAAAAAHVEAAGGADQATSADQLLELQARLAADALLAAGDAGAAAAAQLAASTSKIDQLTAGYYRLATAQAAAGQGVATGGLAALAKGLTGGPTSAGKGQAESLLDRFRREVAAENAAAAERAARSGRGGGGGGGSSRAGGSGRASQAEREAQRTAEQERKFQEQRLKNQQKINDELEDAAREHAENLLDIEKEYQEASLAQQRENEVSKRRSRYDFYSDLTSSEVPDAVQQQLAAAYEAAFAESQRLAQEGKQELAAEYLELKQRQLEAELQFQEAVAAAREKGDQAEVDRLERLAQLRRDAEQAELDALLAEGDSNVNARDEAVAKEAERYAEDQAKIAESAEAASQRKVDAATKSKDAIEAETRALREQADLLEELNRQRLPGGAGAATAPVATAPASAATAPAATAPTDATPADLPASGEVLTRLDRIAGGVDESNRRLEGLRAEIGRAAAAQRSVVNKNS